MNEDCVSNWPSSVSTVVSSMRSVTASSTGNSSNRVTWARSAGNRRRCICRRAATAGCKARGRSRRGRPRPRGATGRRAGRASSLEAGRRHEAERAGLALDAARVRAGQVERGAFGVELVIVGHHQRVAAPRLVLERDGPHVGPCCSLRRMLAPVNSTFLQCAGSGDAELLHALVEDAVADRRAAAHDAVADRDEVEDFSHAPAAPAFPWRESGSSPRCSPRTPAARRERLGSEVMGTSRRPVSSAS